MPLFTLHEGETLNITRIRDRDGEESTFFLRCITGECTLSIPDKFMQESKRVTEEFNRRAIEEGKRR